MGLRYNEFVKENVEGMRPIGTRFKIASEMAVRINAQPARRFDTYEIVGFEWDAEDECYQEVCRLVDTVVKPRQVGPTETKSESVQTEMFASEEE